MFAVSIFSFFAVLAIRSLFIQTTERHSIDSYPQPFRPAAGPTPGRPLYFHNLIVFFIHLEVARGSSLTASLLNAIGAITICDRRLTRERGKFAKCYSCIRDEAGLIGSIVKCQRFAV